MNEYMMDGTECLPTRCVAFSRPFSFHFLSRRIVHHVFVITIHSRVTFCYTCAPHVRSNTRRAPVSSQSSQSSARSVSSGLTTTCVLTAREAGEIDAGAPVCLNSQSPLDARVLRVCAYPEISVAVARAPLAGLRLSWNEQTAKERWRRRCGNLVLAGS